MKQRKDGSSQGNIERLVLSVLVELIDAAQSIVSFQTFQYGCLQFRQTPLLYHISEDFNV